MLFNNLFRLPFHVCDNPLKQLSTLISNMFSKICLFALLALVAAKRPPRFPDDFKWNSVGPVPGWKCIQIIEGAELRSELPQTSYFCQHPGTADIGLQWSSIGPIKGKKCVHIKEGADAHTWHDNYLCTNRKGPNMRWYFSGPKGKCVQWNDIFLCRV